MQQLYDPLVFQNPDGTLRPGLAADWSVTPDGKTWKFKLRSGVTWHDGKPFTSADVAYTIQKVWPSPKNLQGQAVHLFIDTKKVRTPAFLVRRADDSTDGADPPDS